jgi:hypothetical protein
VERLSRPVHSPLTVPNGADRGIYSRSLSAQAVPATQRHLSPSIKATRDSYTSTCRFPCGRGIPRPSASDRSPSFPPRPLPAHHSPGETRRRSRCIRCPSEICCLPFAEAGRLACSLFGSRCYDGLPDKETRRAGWTCTEGNSLQTPSSAVSPCLLVSLAAHVISLPMDPMVWSPSQWDHARLCSLMFRFLGSQRPLPPFCTLTHAILPRRV